MKKRLFVGVPLEEQVRQALDGIDRNLPGLKPVVVKNFHITLKFLGMVDEERISDMSEALRSIKGEPFPIAVQGVGFFSSKGNARVFWAGVREIDRRSLALQHEVESVLDALGFEREKRKFSPHVTLARCRRVAPQVVSQLREKYGEFVAPEFTADRFVLFHSESGPKGVRYHEMESFKLRRERQCEG